ncbi:hypothetical protein LPJ77_001896 [Coemansia sp. RSA 2523]|nr:hypothetical protein LPJ58_001078 [Coemansia sp. RSA 1591]KAJ1809102.1 hypothetical protein LPJ77_001896 [Coemansia sp. RSA 2523]KAJ2146780.1 hypothetical protein IW142_001909 [Coemansia sp. RSA 564]KAJ2157048.1 hypothetical protein GGH15_005439 [Coemansia sp. RSA 562]KAJ2281741.1 hypothetical protein EV176_000267 [Coemansia sp. RSA 451]KAJ2294008.1 hypothetical protein IW141_000621 [Coemansia sp. RSA 355]KAJ2576214.1 hypothetical protein GGH19_002365 [Coemansia sp. RSA 1807]KAJ2837458.1 
MSSSSSHGIHTLLEAEKAASEIVEQARAYRIEHLKEARKMATEDINALQTRKNEELANIQKQGADQSELTKTIQADTGDKLAAITAQFEKNKQDAINKLVSAVTTAELD